MEKISNLKEMLNNCAQKYGEKIAYQLEDDEITYNRLLEDVNCLGTKLIEMGLKGKRIAIISENRYEWEISYLAIATGVGVVVPIDKSLPKIEINRIVEKSKVEVLICSKKYENILKELNIKYIISMDLEESNNYIFSLKQLINQGKHLIKFGDNSFLESKINNDELGFIYFTSGTSDDSKAVMLSHKNICSNLINSASISDINSEDIVLSVLPLNHVLEGLFCFLVSLYKGAKRVYCNDLKNIVECIKNNHITFMASVPALYEIIYNELVYNNEYQNIKKQINVFFSGGSALSSKLKQKYKDIGIDLVQGYGLTETAPVVAIENKANQKEGSVRKSYTKLKNKYR